MKNIIFVAAVVFSFILMGYGLYNGHRAKNNAKIAPFCIYNRWKSVVAGSICRHIGYSRS